MTLIIFLMLQATPTMSFDQLAQTALTQNKGLQAAREQLQQAEARLKQAGLRPNPSLDISRSTDVVFANEGENGFAVMLSQPFELGGKREKRIRVAEAEVDLAKADFADAERQLIGQLKTAYLRAAETAATEFLRGHARAQQADGSGDDSPIRSRRCLASGLASAAGRKQPA
jgi:outer membrane protein TolC